MSDNLQQPGTNGQPAPEVGAAGLAARLQSERAAVRAEILKAATAEPEPVVEAPPKVEQPDEDAPDAAAAREGTDGGASSSSAPDAAAAARVEKTDPDTSKRLAAVQAAEKRGREKLTAERKQIEAERAAFEKERAELAAQRKDLDAYQKARERAKLDPVGALEALGVDDLEYAAKQLYAKAKADPSNKEAAARMMREREAAERLEAIERRLAERETAEKERSVMEQARAAATRFMGAVEKAATTGADAPLAKVFLAKAPDKTRAQLGKIALELYDETGDEPQIDDVLARFEKTRREELLEYGVDPDSLTTPGQKKNDQAAAKKNAAKTLSSDLSTTRVPRPPSSDRELRAQVRAQLESGKLD